MRIEFTNTYTGGYGDASPGEIRVVSRDAGKFLIRAGYAKETDGLTVDEAAVIEHNENQKPGPNVVVVPMPGEKHYETLPYSDEEE